MIDSDGKRAGALLKACEERDLLMTRFGRRTVQTGRQYMPVEETPTKKPPVEARIVRRERRVAGIAIDPHGAIIDRLRLQY